MLNARGTSNAGGIWIDLGLNAFEDDGVVGLVTHDPSDAIVISVEGVGLADGLVVGRWDDEDAMESREEGASS